MELDVSVPRGTEADVVVPVDRFTAPTLAVDGRPVPLDAAAGRPGPATVARVSAGSHRFVVTGALIAIPSPAKSGDLSAVRVKIGASSPPVEAKIDVDSCAAFEADVLKSSLIAPGPGCCLARIDEHVSHAGGGKTAACLTNGTTLNGAHEEATADDGETFRGYGDNDWVTFYLDTAKNPQGYDITKIATFAGHGDTRASQNYSISVARVSAAEKFLPLVSSASVHCESGSSEMVVANRKGGALDNGRGLKASGVAAIRFDFKSGSAQCGRGLGFNVYREIGIAGEPTANVRR